MCNFHQRVSRQDDEELQGALDARIAAVMGVTKYPRRMVIQTTTGWWFGTFSFSHILGISSSQLTKSTIFQRGGEKQSTRLTWWKNGNIVMKGYHGDYMDKVC